MTDATVPREADLAPPIALQPVHVIWGAVALLAVICWLAAEYYPWVIKFPKPWTLPITAWLGDVSEAVTGWLKPLARAFSAVLAYPMDFANVVLTQSRWPAVFAVIAALGWWIGGWRLGLISVAMLGFILASGYWRESMSTLALIVVSVPLALATGLVIGVAAYRSAGLRPAIEAALDFMQTVPTFAYLVPLLVLFGFGPVVGLIASAIYAAPPMARNTLLGLRLVHPEIKDAADMAGATSLQKLLLVEIPSASSQIMVGVNQSIMAALSMVIIAAVIGGFNDIGWEVLLTMRKAQFGEALLAGSVIVVFAMLLDRMSAELAGEHVMADRTGQKIALGIAAAGILIAIILPGIISDPTDFRWLKRGSADVSTALDSFVRAYGGILQAIKSTVLFYVMLPLKIGLDNAVLVFTWGFKWTDSHTLGYLAAVTALALGTVLAGRPKIAIAIAFIGYVVLVGVTDLPWPVVLAVVGGIGWLAGGPRLMVFCVLSFAAILLSGLWGKAMQSIYLCTLAALFCAVFGIALGLLGAVSSKAWAVIRPICDMLQTIPLFVFLIPVLMLFQIGEFSAFLAIVAYAIVPIIRYTQFGVSSTPASLVEAAVANGCTPFQLLFMVRLPYAVPSILLGMNQTILYAFAMLVIAALIGTTDLGQSIYVALGRADLGLGLSAGIAMALLAMVADRIVQGFAAEQKRAMGLE